jgi:hypothetical protein
MRLSVLGVGWKREASARACDSLAALAPLFFPCHLRGLFLFGASGSGAPLMDAFFSATLSRPPLERVLIWVVRATGTLIGCHGRNIRSIFPGRYPDSGGDLKSWSDCGLPDRRQNGPCARPAYAP